MSTAELRSHGPWATSKVRYAEDPDFVTLRAIHVRTVNEERNGPQRARASGQYYPGDFIRVQIGTGAIPYAVGYPREGHDTKSVRAPPMLNVAPDWMLEFAAEQPDRTRRVPRHRRPMTPRWSSVTQGDQR